LVVDVISESPAEKQGVRAGSRLAKINGMHVEPWVDGRIFIGERCEFTTRGQVPGLFEKSDDQGWFH